MAFVIGRIMASRVPRVIGRGFSKSADSAFFEAWKRTNSKKTAEELEDFLIKTRRGLKVSNDEILSFAKLFNDELTLDNISRPRLFNLCKYTGISPFGTDDAYLRYMLLKHLERIKADDKLIQEQGVDSLSEAELRENCRKRGMLGLLSVEEMHQQLRDWLYLSLNHSVPASLLILSRAFTGSGILKPEVIHFAISSLPDEVQEALKKILKARIENRMDTVDAETLNMLKLIEHRLDTMDQDLKKSTYHFWLAPILSIAMNEVYKYFIQGNPYYSEELENVLKGILNVLKDILDELEKVSKMNKETHLAVKKNLQKSIWGWLFGGSDD